MYINKKNKFWFVYLHFCLFKSIAHIITDTQNTRTRYHKFPRQNPLSNISRYPQKAGKIRPVVLRKPGSRLAGNIIPESIIEGKKTSCAIIVSFAWFFTTIPNMLPMPSDTIIYIASARKKNGSCTGRTASNSIGASSNIMAQLAIRCTNAEKNIVTRPKYKGTPFAL